jgi:hypothetical protein
MGNVLAKLARQHNKHSWVVFQLRTTPAKLIGVVHDQPDALSAIKAALKKFDVPPDQRHGVAARVALNAKSTLKMPPQKVLRAKDGGGAA